MRNRRRRAHTEFDDVNRRTDLRAAGDHLAAGYDNLRGPHHDESADDDTGADDDDDHNDTADHDDDHHNHLDHHHYHHDDHHTAAVRRLDQAGERDG